MAYTVVAALQAVPMVEYLGSYLVVLYHRIVRATYKGANFQAVAGQSLQQFMGTKSIAEEEATCVYTMKLLMNMPSI